MSEKMDRQGARTAAELEQKYAYGKRFAEIMGIASDAQTAAQTAQDAASKPAENLTPDEIFNILTNYGEEQGIYRENGKIYINASYLRSGVITSANGAIQIDLSADTEPVFNTGISTNGISVRGDAVNAETLFKVWADMQQTVDGVDVPSVCCAIRSADGCLIGAMTEIFNPSHEPSGISFQFINHERNRVAEIFASSAYAGLRVRSVASGNIVGQVVLNEYGEFVIEGLDKINGKTVSWKDNGDGTFTLIGR